MKSKNTWTKTINLKNNKVEKTNLNYDYRYAKYY
jgi:hypothetical protein